MEEIEISSRLYDEGGASYMTATLPAYSDDDAPVLAPVSFVLTHARLITVRYHEPRVFQTFPQRAGKLAPGCNSGAGVLLALLDATVDRLADLLERAGGDIDGISRRIFQHDDGKPTKNRELKAILASIGRKGDLTSKIRDSLATLERLVGFFNQGVKLAQSPKEMREGVRTLLQDIHSLTDHAGFLSQKITFLLDATLGMVNLEQNAIIKILSVAAVVFLPPTLLASIYGMNFTHMPELDWRFAYPIALGLMLVSAVLPYFFFKRRGWL
jgi:magnesium transporter